VKRSLLAAALLLIAGVDARSAFADTRAATLGGSASASDYYQVTCSDDGSGPPASFSVQVSDAPPVAAPIVSVQVRAFRPALPSPPTPAYAARNSTDPSDGDAVSSPLVFVNFGAGTFDVFVDKTAAGSEDYVLTFLCTTALNGGGVRTGTAITASSVAAPVPVPVLGLVGQLALCALLIAGLARGAFPARSLGGAAGATDYYQVAPTTAPAPLRRSRCWTPRQPPRR
jgi:hypothetical protein